MGVVDKEKVWEDFKCPVCGKNNFTSGERYELLDAGGLLNAMKGRPGKSFEARAIVCRECGYIVFKKGI